MKLTDFSVTPANSVSETALNLAIADYRTIVAQRYTPCAPELLGKYLPIPPFYVSRKIDGELWFLDTTGPKVRLVAANGRIASGECELLKQASQIPPGLLIAGELHTLKDGRERVGDVPTALQGGLPTLAFSAFDLVENAGKSWSESSYSGRLEELGRLVPSGLSNLKVVATKELNSESEILDFYAETVTTGGAEGIIVRCSDGRILKIKPTVNIDVVVLAFTEDLSAGNENQVRSLLLGLVQEDGRFIPVSSTGNFVSEFSRSQLLKTLKPLIVESSFRQAASTGQLYQFVKPQVLIEVQVLDVQSVDNQGRRIRQVPLTYSEAGYQASHKVSAASFINPVAVRERLDKPDVMSGARWGQISEFVPATTEQGQDLPSAEIVRRQVWTKKTGDKTDVRKLVVIKTNKELSDASYPAFVVHWTDFSLGRKSPLTREVKVAPSLKRAEEIANQMVDEGIKKGWEEA